MRLQEAKQKVLEVGKAAQMIKEEAKTAFDNDEYNSDNQGLYEWVVKNAIVPSYHTFKPANNSWNQYPAFPAVYYEYKAASQACLGALQQIDPNAVQE